MTPSELKLSFQQTIDNAGHDEALLRFLTQTAHQTSARVDEQLQDARIRAYSSRPHGARAKSLIALTTGKQNKKITKDKGREHVALAALDHQLVYAPKQKSELSKPVVKRTRPPSYGNGNHLPMEEKEYCIYCNAWVAGLSKHERSGLKHAKNAKSGVTYAFCQTCKTGHLTGAVCPIQSHAVAAVETGDTTVATDDEAPLLKPKAAGGGGRATVKGAGKSTTVAGNKAAASAGGV
jgi:hypothetical protein